MFIKLHEQRQEGFTLVELIIVLAIIGILTALAISRISYNRTRAAKDDLQRHHGRYQEGAEAYYADSGEKLVDDITATVITSAGYMAGTPRTPHGASVTEKYHVDWNIKDTAWADPSTGNKQEVARVQCPWTDDTLAAPAQVVFPEGHTF